MTLSTSPVSPVTYAAMPREGSRPDTATLLADHCWLPLLAGQQIMVHCPSRTVFDADGKHLALSHHETALGRLQTRPFQWLHCVLPEYEIARGTLFVCDWIIGEGVPFTKRRAVLERQFISELLTVPPEKDAVYLLPRFTPDMAGSIAPLLPRLNFDWNTRFYDGLLGIRLQSDYPLQLHVAGQRTADWIACRL